VIRRLLTSTALVVTLSACAGGNDRPSEADGRKVADDTKRPVAAAYWRLNHSIGDAAFTASADGQFERCDRGEQDLVRYTVGTILSSRDSTGKKETEEKFFASVTARFAGVGWHLSQGLHRYATKQAVTAELSPSPISGIEARAEFQVYGKCVDAGAATDKLLFETGADIYRVSEGGGNNSSATPSKTSAQ
jgi:hypothetical protein